MNDAYKPNPVLPSAPAAWPTLSIESFGQALERTAEGSMDDYPTREKKVAPPAPVKTTADTLEAMAATFRERNAVYGSNYKMVGPMMAILFPTGVPIEVLASDQFHLFELIIVKLSRLAISGLQHEDSAHDAGVYCAMIETIIKEQK